MAATASTAEEDPDGDDDAPQALPVSGASLHHDGCGSNGRDPPDAARSRRTSPRAKIWEKFLVKSQTLSLLILAMSVSRPIHDWH